MSIHLFIFIGERQRERKEEGKRGREGEKGFFFPVSSTDSLVHFPNGHNSLSWAKQIPGFWTFNHVFHMDDSDSSS